MKNFLIELILTNQCNKRCDYCDLNFKNKSFSFKELDLFIEFLKNNKAIYTINFFGFEPLLAFDKLKYFLDNSKLYVKKFSLWTNWILLDENKLKYFKDNNVTIYLSIDNIKLWNDLNLDLLSNYKDIININFVNDPYFLCNSIEVYNKIKKIGFKNISFMPVFSTRKWDKSKLYDLNKIYKYIKQNNNWISLKKFSYFNWISIDRQFILDTDLWFYSDLDSLLWLQNQYKNTDLVLKKEINSKTKLDTLLNKKLTSEILFDLYNIKDIIKLIFEIPKKSWDIVSYKIIDKILKND